MGLLIIAPYVVDNMKRLYCLWKKDIDKTLVALIVSFITMIFVHGVLDYTIFFVQTGFLFLLISSSFDIYRKEI